MKILLGSSFTSSLVDPESSFGAYGVVSDPKNKHKKFIMP